MWLLFILITANIIDCFCTPYWINIGVAKEGNPFMDFLINIDPYLFIIVKISLVTIAGKLVHNWNKKYLILPTTIYLTVIVYHLFIAIRLMFN